MNESQIHIHICSFESQGMPDREISHLSPVSVKQIKKNTSHHNSIFIILHIIIISCMLLRWERAPWTNLDHFPLSPASFLAACRPILWGFRSFSIVPDHEFCGWPLKRFQCFGSLGMSASAMSAPSANLATWLRSLRWHFLIKQLIGTWLVRYSFV